MRQSIAKRFSYRLQPTFAEFFNGEWVIAQVFLQAN